MTDYIDLYLFTMFLDRSSSNKGQIVIFLIFSLEHNLPPICTFLNSSFQVMPYYQRINRYSHLLGN